jgi:hypothetical protein
LKKYFIIASLLTVVFSSCKNNELFETLDYSETGVDFSNRVEERDSLSILDYLYMYNGGGVAVGDIDNDGRTDFYLGGNQVANALYRNKGDFQFEDVTQKAGVAGDVGPTYWTNAVSFVDINADGWLDIYTCRMYGFRNFKGKNQLFINNQDGTFTERAEDFGLDVASYSQEASFFDYDLDGDLDMFLVNMSLKSPSSYKMGELREQRNHLIGDRLYENKDGFFVDVSKEAGIHGGDMGYGLSVSVGDLNNDGYPDIYVANDFYENDYMYYNKGDGTFDQLIDKSTGHTPYFSMGTDMADINNDGWMDILTLDMKPMEEKVLKRSIAPESYSSYQFKKKFGYHDQFGRNMLQVNRGTLFGSYSSFSELGEFYGVDATDWSWGCLLADMDLDGNKDVFITNGIPRRPNDLDYINYTSNETLDNGQEYDFEKIIEQMPSGNVPNKAFKNTGNRFEEVSKAWGLDLNGYSNGAAYGDLDGDGDLDLIVNNLDAPTSLYRNKTVENEKGNYLKIHLKGPKNNTFGIGARVLINTNESEQIQEHFPVKGWLSSVEPMLLFGLGESENIDYLKVDWGNGRIQELRDVEANETLVLEYSDASSSTVEVNKELPKPLFARAIAIEENLDYRHKENEYIDFDYEVLLPKMVSTQGPRMAVADINGDGLEDFFIGGAKDQAGELYVQQRDSVNPFVRVDTEVFFSDRAEEDVESTFIDVNRDGLLDLYVVSGSGELLDDYTGADRLYMNVGNNQFVKSNRHPSLNFNGSCVTKGDFNRDGIDDLFVGGRSIPGSYGKYPSSRVLLGDGNGNLIDYTMKMFGGNFALGMVTDAVWLNQTKELVVAGDWMPITKVNFSRDTITIKSIEITSGWWNALEVADLDNDGDDDLLAGNLGLNTYLKASKEYPVSLYVMDFDNNSSIDPVMTHYKEGAEVSFYSKDALSKQLVAINKIFTDYQSFAQSPFHEIFTLEDLRGAGRWQVDTFESMALINQGDGKFERRPLPKSMQIAPIYGFTTDDFDSDGFLDVLAIGNHYGNQLGLGKYDASYGHFLKGDGNWNWETVEPLESGFAVEGQGRSISKIRTTDGKQLLLIGRNNAPLMIFEKSNPK